jgi:hypothetical protein
VYTPADVERLAEVSRRYREAASDIRSAIVQELRCEPTPEHRAQLAVRFGMTEAEVTALCSPSLRALYEGYVHRANLNSPPRVYTLVMHDVEAGKFRSGDQLPPRTTFTERYHCNKLTHGQVVERLLRNGVVHRPGGNGGPLYIV